LLVVGRRSYRLNVPASPSASQANKMTTSAQVAIVTGGNSGMGMGIVRRLVEKGWKVAIADINENKTFAEELGDASSYHKCNVADYDR
jgi:NAD(P)-dependent dehydrogenase (short-subunit alcohol dehydrogenase family)